MIKQKLIEKRKERNFTQEDFAFKLGIETSNYNRRENGVTKISKAEWDKMAKLLETTLEEIYKPEDGVYVIKNENANGNYSGSNNFFSNQDDFVFETMKKYIQKLEEENELLKAQLKK
jgi:transcriptional regulator with XRE-family HTH domain